MEIFLFVKNFLMSYMDKTILNTKSILDNKHVFWTAMLFGLVFGGLVRPPLPNYIMDLFDNTLFKIFVLFLIVYTGTKDPKLSLLVALIFMTIMYFVAMTDAHNKYQQISEHFTSSSPDKKNSKNNNKNKTNKYVKNNKNSKRENNDDNDNDNDNDNNYDNENDNNDNTDDNNDNTDDNNDNTDDNTDDNDNDDKESKEGFDCMCNL
jgi:hypothetical protein